MEHTEPKHKPSPKHALDDVLSSLQDLMHNELNDAQPPSPIAAPATRRGGGKVSAGDVLSSLKGLIDNNRDGNTAAPTQAEAELLELDEPTRTELAIRRKMQNIKAGGSSGLISADDIEIEAVAESEYIDDSIELTADDSAIEDIVEELEELPTGPDENEAVTLSADAAGAEEIELSAFAENNIEKLTANAIEVEEIPPADAAMVNQVDIITDDAAPLFTTDAPASFDDSIDHVDTDDPDIPTLNTVEDIPTLKLEDGTPLSDMDPELNLPGDGNTDLTSPQHKSAESDLDELAATSEIPDINSSDVATQDNYSVDDDLDFPTDNSALILDDEISLDLDAPSDSSTLEGKKNNAEKKPDRAKKSRPIPNDFVEKALQDIDDTLDYLSIKEDKPLPAETQSRPKPESTPKPKAEAKPKPELRREQEKVVLKIDENTRPPRLEPGTPPDADALRNNPFLQSQDETPEESDDTITLSSQADEDNEQPTIRLENSKTDTTAKKTAGEENFSLDLPPIKPNVTEKKPQQAKTPAPKTKTKEKPAKARAKTKPVEKPVRKTSKTRPAAQKTKAKAKPEQAQAKKKTATQPKARPVQRKKPVIQRARLAKGKKIGHQVEIDWDDIPVLDQNTNQIRTKTREKERAKVKTRGNGAGQTRATPAPQKKSGKEKKVREIAIKAIAKLNIQLRKTGGQSLEPIMVDRLQTVLKEVLDTPGTKGDNKPVKKK